MTVVDVSTERTVFDYARELLLACQEALATTRGGPIERAYVCPNALSLDCTSLLVIPQTLTLAPAGGAVTRGSLGSGHAHQFGRVNQLGFLVVVARECIPATKSRVNPSAPKPEELEGWAWTVSEDVWAIWCLLPRRMKEGALFGGPCMELSLDSATALATSGQIGGWQIALRATIPGIDTD